jgi:hypothetical protein
MVRAAGVLFVAWTVVVAVRGLAIGDARQRRNLLVVALGLWLVAIVAFVGLLHLERGPYAGADVCHALPGGDDSAFPRTHFEWLPAPGAVCEYPSGDVGPTLWRGAVAVVLAGLPLTVAALTLRRRRELGT